MTTSQLAASPQFTELQTAASAALELTARQSQDNASQRKLDRLLNKVAAFLHHVHAEAPADHPLRNVLLHESISGPGEQDTPLLKMYCFVFSTLAG